MLCLAGVSYRCLSCADEFRSWELLSQHQKVRQHPLPDPAPTPDGVPCPSTRCSKSYVTSAHLLDHLAGCHAADKCRARRCAQCGLEFRALPWLQQLLAWHALYHLAAQVTQCGHCRQHLHSARALRAHLDSHADVPKAERQRLHRLIATGLAGLNRDQWRVKNFLADFLGLPHDEPDTPPPPSPPLHLSSAGSGGLNLPRDGPSTPPHISPAITPLIYMVTALMGWSFFFLPILHILT